MDNQSNFKAAHRHRGSSAKRSGPAPKTILKKESLAEWPELRKTLDNVVASRPEAVARARRLIADPGYPPPYVERLLAQKLAKKLLSETDDSPT